MIKLKSGTITDDRTVHLGTVNQKLADRAFDRAWEAIQELLEEEEEDGPHGEAWSELDEEDQAEFENELIELQRAWVFELLSRAGKRADVAAAEFRKPAPASSSTESNPVRAKLKRQLMGR